MTINNTKKIVLSGMLIALGVVCSTFYIPIGIVKCFPIQHAINVVAGVLLGPFYATAMAFCTSLIRVGLGTGSLLAFPGSMIGALLCGLAYKYSKKITLTLLGELIGTGIIGAIVAYPVATFLMGKEAALFAFVIPFSVSSLGGVLIGSVFIYAISKIKIFNLKGSKNV